jgi:DNA-binding PadR family transcriptional regulator
MSKLIGETKFEILALLADEPTHGYQLHVDLGLTTATIYQHLEELADAGMIEPLSESGPRKEIKYRLTSDGKLLYELISRNTTQNDD